ncbi:hypothetical protein RISK_000203 [Rhodopirellula islandica]|uniref:Uncharacterized protein n=1 Tax=Rhodopirellula islandica TaxID=595434 RepID=A0A0J1BME0_RHOIS|nr:hypothetical protein RISK_000203 [Rhodopirellula islandica]
MKDAKIAGPSRDSRAVPSSAPWDACVRTAEAISETVFGHFC